MQNLLLVLLSSSCLAKAKARECHSFPSITFLLPSKLLPQGFLGQRLLYLGHCSIAIDALILSQLVQTFLNMRICLVTHFNDSIEIMLIWTEALYYLELEDNLR